METLEEYVATEKWKNKWEPPKTSKKKKIPRSVVFENVV
jgi:hypothetical protein